MKRGRSQCSPHELYFEKLRVLEMEVHGRVTLSREEVGPSIQEIFRSLRKQSVESMDPISVIGDTGVSGLPHTIKN